MFPGLDRSASESICLLTTTGDVLAQGDEARSPLAQFVVGVRSVDLNQSLQRARGLGERVDVAAVLLEVLERLRCIVDRRLGQLGESVTEVRRQFGIDAIAYTGVSHDVQ